VRLVVTPDTADVVGVGDTVRFEARAADAGGGLLVGAPSVTWGVSDPAVAQVDSAGLVSATGMGVATVTASSASGLTGSATVRVFGAGAPTIISVAPSPLREGQEATVRGSGFRPATSEDTVLVDGMRASILSVAPGSLRIRVPTYDCLPARSVALRVSMTQGAAADTSVELAAAGTPVSLDPGQRMLVQDPATFCLQFGPEAGARSYLLGVQAAATSADALVPDALTPVTLTAVVEGSASASASAAPGPVADLQVTRHESEHRHADDDSGQGGSDGADGSSPERLAQAAAETRLDEWSREHLDPAASIPARRASASASPWPVGLEAVRLATAGAGTVAGDTLLIRVPDGTAQDLCASFTEIRAVVRFVGDRAILAEDVANPSGGMSLAQYQTLSGRLDSQIVGTLSAYFGEPTDIDGNGRVVAVFTKEVNRSWAGAAAFVFGGDFYARSAPAGSFSCPSSDEGEIYYSRAPDPTGIYGTPVTATSLRARAPLIMAHELTHVIQQGRRFAQGGPWMASWMMEGQAVLAQEVVGHAVMGNAPGSDYGVQVAYSHDGDGTYWYREPFQGLRDYYGYVSSASRVSGAPAGCGWLMSDPSPCAGVSAWYTAGWAFLRWLSDALGPTVGGERALHRALIDDRVSGFDNVQAVVGHPWRTLLADWAASLYVDGRVPAADPAVTMPSWDLYGIYDAYGTDTGIQPLEEGFGSWSASEDVRTGSSAYVRLSDTGGPAMALRVRDASDATLAPGTQIWVVRLQ
jgi:hypothetical protein